MAKSGVPGLLLAFWLSGCSCGELVLGQPSDHPRGPPHGGVTDGGTVTDAKLTDGSGGFDGGSERGPHSGSRIKVRGFRADDAVIPLGVLWDDARGVACSPTLASDGTERCLPSTGPREVWFTDSDCKNPVILERSSDPCAAPDPHPYATAEVLVRCPPSGLSVFAKGGKVTAPADAYVSSGFGCTAVSSIDASNSFFEAVPSPSSDWVRFHEDVTKVTDRLGVAYWDGTDGSRVLNGLRLLKENIACQETTADGSGVSPQLFDPTIVERCAPSNSVALLSGFFAGDTCQTEVGLTLECSPPGMTVGEVVYPAIDAGAVSCQPYSGGVATFYGAVAVPSPSVYTSGPGQCTPTQFGGFHYYKAGTPLRFEDFPLLTITHAGTGRFQPVYTVSDGQALYMHPLELYDTQASRFCSVGALGSDPRLFCVSYLAIAQYSLSSGPYADPKCTTHLVQVDGSCGAPPPVAAQEIGFPGPCAPAILRRIMGVHTSPTYTNGSPFPEPSAGPCVPEQPGLGVDYDIGGAVDPAALFPLMTPTDL